MKIALFLPNWVGDAVMATPALRTVRTGLPTAELVAVLRPHIADVLAGLDVVDRFLFHDPRGRECDHRGWRLIRRMRQERFDAALLLPNSLRSGLIAWLSGAKRRVGFARDGRGLLLTDRLAPRPKAPPHPVLDEYLRLAGRLVQAMSDDSGAPSVSRRMELAVLPEDEWQLDRFWQRHDPRLRERGVVCLNPGGAFGAAKHWSTKSFAALARRIAGELGRTVLVLCGPAERDDAREIARRAAHPHVVSLADVSPGLGLTKAAVMQADLLVTTDSGPRHFAAPFGVPVVTLFGPTHIAWSETGYEKALHLQLRLDCGPCQQRTCPLHHHRCMKELTVEKVYEGVVSMLKRHAPSRRAAS